MAKLEELEDLAEALGVETEDLLDELGLELDDLDPSDLDIDPDEDDLEEVFEEIAEMLDLDVHSVYEWFYKDSP